ncbi:MAG TPA: AAA family ATPase [Arthrobacter sp.]
MNTSESYAGPAPRIGLIELPELADALTGLGLQVVTAQDFRGGVAAIKEGFATYGAFPLIVTNRPIAGLRAWVDRIKSVVDTPVAVVRDGGEPSITSENVIELHLPVTLNAVLAAVGVRTAGPAGDQVFPAPAAQAPGVNIDFDFEFDEPEAAAQAQVLSAPPAVAAPENDDLFGFVPVPAALAAAPEEPVFAAANPNDPFDVFDTPTSAGPAGGFSFSPAAPEEADWNTAPAAPAAQGFVPAPAETAPAETAQDFSWDTVAAATPVQEAPVQEAPASWSQPAAAEPSWDTPAPGFVAPAQEMWDTPAPQTQAYEVPVQAAPVFAPAPEPAADFGRDTTPATQDWNAQAPAAQPFVAPAPVQAPAAPMPEAWAQAQPVQAAFGGPDASSVFDSFEAAKLHGTGRSASGLASLVIVWSGKGGVGKSTNSLELAALAAETGARVILIDGNSGQGDLRTYLRLNRTDVPTIYSAALGNIAGSVLSPAAINNAELSPGVPARQGLGEIKFGFVAAPPEDIEDGEIVTNATYRAVIEHCRRNADIVIMDTQIIEAIDRTGVLTDLLIPAFVQDAWGVGVADMNAPGVNSLNARLRKFAANGVAPDRQMIIVNKVPEAQIEDAAKLESYFAGRARFLGTVTEDSGIRDNMNAGRIEVTNPQMRAALATALYTVTGNDEFRRISEVPSPAAATGATVRKIGFWGRMTGKKAAA